MSSAAQLSRGAVDFLLQAMEASTLRITAVALSLELPALAEVLLGRRYLVPDGYEAELTSSDFDDRPIALSWSEDSQRYGLFDAASGWVDVDHQDVNLFRIDMNHVISSLTSEFGLVPGTGPRMLIQDLLWDVGTCRFGKRTKMMSVLFARRVGQPELAQLVRRALQTRPLNEECVLLTSTPSEHVPPLTVRLIVSVRDIIGDGLTLDPNRIAAMLDVSTAVIPTDRIVLLANGKEVVFFGRSYSFARGFHQRRIVKFIYDRHEEGEHLLSVDYVVAELGLRDRARIRDYFKKHDAWDTMLFEKEGKCGFILKRS